MKKIIKNKPNNATHWCVLNEMYYMYNGIAMRVWDGEWNDSKVTYLNPEHFIEL